MNSLPQQRKEGASKRADSHEQTLFKSNEVKEAPNLTCMILGYIAAIFIALALVPFMEEHLY